MKKIILSFLISFIICGLLVIQDVSAAACPSDVVKASNGICGVDDAVKESDGWCCRTSTEAGSGKYECKNGYCGSPDGAGGKYTNHKCCKLKSPATVPPTPPPADDSASSSVSVSGLNPAGSTDVPTIIGKGIKTILGVVGAIALFMVVYGGILMLTSAGNPATVKKGKDVLIWSLIGIVVIFGSFYLTDFVISGIKGTGGGGGAAPQTQTPPLGHPNNSAECQAWGGDCTDTKCTQEFSTNPASEYQKCLDAWKTAQTMNTVSGKCPSAQNYPDSWICAKPNQ